MHFIRQNMQERINIRYLRTRSGDEIQMDEQKLKAAGIDYKGAIERFADNQVLYEKYLLRFETDTHCKDAMAALEEQNYDEVLAQVHALKGMVGTLGMMKCYQVCQDVVDALRAKKYDAIAGLMEKVQEEQVRIQQIYKDE